MVSKLRTMLLAAPLALCLGVALPVISADKADSKADSAKKGKNVDPAKRAASPSADAVALAAMADRLAQYGDRNKDALALITAAKIFSEVGVRDEKREKTSEGKGDDKAGKSQPRDQSVAALLARAKEYAGGRKDLIAIADETAKTGKRGAVAGPIRHIDTVLARRTDIYNVAFRGGESAMLQISGDGDTDLDLIVKDEYGNVICVSDGAGDDESCRWTPQWTGNFRIEVRNLGSVWNRYRMWSN